MSKPLVQSCSSLQFLKKKFSKLLLSALKMIERKRVFHKYWNVVKSENIQLFFVIKIAYLNDKEKTLFCHINE